MTILRMTNSSTVQDLACMLNNIHLLIHCPYGMDFSFMIEVGPRSASQLVKSFFLIRWSAWLTFFISAHFIALGLRCPVHYSAQTKTKNELFCSSTRCNARMCCWHNITPHHLQIAISTLTSKITCIFNSQLPHINNSNVTHTYSTIWPTYAHHYVSSMS